MPVHIEVIDRIALVTLDRPEALNALDASMRRAVQDAWTRIAEDSAIDLAIITGAGERAFSAGADLKAPAEETPFSDERLLPGGSDSLTATLPTDKPLICAFNGLAMGGGLEIGLACDIRIAESHARFGLSEVRVGTIPGSGGTQRLPRIVGDAQAAYLLLTGDTIDAAEALRIGLVSELVAQPEKLLERAFAIARRIQANAPLAIRAVKQLLSIARSDLQSGLQTERNLWGALRDSDDRREGRTAFKEKRAPRYRGC